MRKVLFLLMLSGCGCMLRGSLVDMPVDVDIPVEATAEVTAEVKADVKATGADLSKTDIETNTVGGDQIKTTTNDSKMIIYIFGAVMTLISTIFAGIMTLMSLLIRKMFIQSKADAKIIHDLGNDGKQILLETQPQITATIHKAYENCIKLCEEYIKEKKK